MCVRAGARESKIFDVIRGMNRSLQEYLLNKINVTYYPIAKI